MALELNDLALKTSAAEVPLKHPLTGVPMYDGDSPVNMLLFGKASKQYRKAMQDLMNRKQPARNSRASEKFDFDKSAAENAEVLSHILVGITNLEYDGEALDNPATIRKMLADTKFSWVIEQVNEALDDLENFM